MSRFADILESWLRAIGVRNVEDALDGRIHRGLMRHE
jgi:hypothetical protein